MSADARRERLRVEVLAGLAATPKRLPCKYFYDARGSALFEQITQLDVYYPTRTELAILADHGAEIASTIGARALVLEPGAGAGRKTRLLLEALHEPAAYVPVEIDAETLRATEAALSADFPQLPIVPLAADYTLPFTLPAATQDLHAERSLLFYPGSTIGNFDPPAAVRFLANLAERLPDPVQLLIGVDLHKDPAVLTAAYDDPDGITAEFNRNILRHINDVLGSSLDPDAFKHVAFYDADKMRIEMHLESTCAQVVEVAGLEIAFTQGERIHTESSYKYTLAGFRDLAARAGYRHRRTWTDPDVLFSVQLFDWHATHNPGS
jgi:L-histidine Nalpha-methyltransferase